MPTLTSLVSTYRFAPVYSQTNTSGQTAKWTPVFGTTQKVTDGSTANKANRIYVAKGTLSASATTTLNVSSGLTDQYGNAIALTRVCEVIVEHLSESASTSTVTVGGGTNPIWATMSVPLYKGGLWHFRDYSTTGVAITTNVNLKLTNDSGSLVATYRVILVGSQ